MRDFLVPTAPRSCSAGCEEYRCLCALPWANQQETEPRSGSGDGSTPAAPGAPAARGPRSPRGRSIWWRILGVAAVVTLVSATVAVRGDDSPAAATDNGPVAVAPSAALRAEHSRTQKRAVELVESATLTVAAAAGKVDDALRDALRTSVDELVTVAAPPAPDARDSASFDLGRLRSAIDDTERLDARTRRGIELFDLEQAQAAEVARVAAEQAAAEQAAAEQAAAEQAAAEQAAAEQAAAEEAAAQEAARPPRPAPSAQAAPTPPPSIQEVGEATLRGLPGNGGVSLSWDDPGLSGHLGGVWKGNTSTILVNASRLAGQPSKTKDVIRHEIAHIYQGRLMASHGMSWPQIDGLMASAFGSNASEKVADCVALRFGASWVNYTSDCSGADKQAWVDGLIGGYLP